MIFKVYLLLSPPTPLSLVYSPWKQGWIWFLHHYTQISVAEVFNNLQNEWLSIDWTLGCFAYNPGLDKGIPLHSAQKGRNLRFHSRKYENILNECLFIYVIIQSASQKLSFQVLQQNRIISQRTMSWEEINSLGTQSLGGIRTNTLSVTSLWGRMLIRRARTVPLLKTGMLCSSWELPYWIKSRLFILKEWSLF
jgi:hypothetical protein